jgi:hypothetical protein
VKKTSEREEQRRADGWIHLNLKISLAGFKAKEIYLQTLIALPYLRTTSALRTVTTFQPEDYTARHEIN